MLQSRSRRFVLALASATVLSLLSLPVTAAEADPATARINAFYDVLLDTMKSAQRTPVRARYDRLEPAVRAAFDLPAMTRIAVGPTWTSIGGDDQKSLLEQFGRLTIATYANRFDAYSGERFDVAPAADARGANRIVHSKLIRPKGDPVALDYLMHPADETWKAIDVYLSGTISEIATRRSEFGALLRSGGPTALIDSLRQRADKLLQPG